MQQSSIGNNRDIRWIFDIARPGLAMTPVMKSLDRMYKCFRFIFGIQKHPHKRGCFVVVVDVVVRSVTTYVFFGGMFVFVTFADMYCTRGLKKAQAKYQK